MVATSHGIASCVMVEMGSNYFANKGLHDLFKRMKSAVDFIEALG
jgi:hypothetical protein